MKIKGIECNEKLFEELFEDLILGNSYLRNKIITLIERNLDLILKKYRGKTIYNKLGILLYIPERVDAILLFHGDEYYSGITEPVVETNGYVYEIYIKYKNEKWIKLNSEQLNEYKTMLYNNGFSLGEFLATSIPVSLSCQEVDGVLPEFLVKIRDEICNKKHKKNNKINNTSL